MAYQNKIVIEWNGTTYSTKIDPKSYSAKLFTGSISNDPQRPNAYVCAGATIWEFTLSQSRGRFKKSILKNEDSILCSTDLQNNLKVFSRKHMKFLKNETPYGDQSSLRGDQIRLGRVGENFVIMDENGEATFYDGPGRIIKEDTILSGLEPHWSLASSDKGILVADSFGTYVIELDQKLNWTKIQIPATPCEDKQVCGLSFADDGSWFVVGFWGAYHGIGRTFSRVPVYNLPGKFAGVGASHTGNGGRFLYFGLNNGDRGKLPKIKLLKNQNNLRTSKTSANYRKFIWTKDIPSGEFEYIGKVKLSKNRFLHLSIVDQLKNKASIQQLVLEEVPISYSITPKFKDIEKSPYQIHKFETPWWRERLEIERIHNHLKMLNYQLPTIRVGVVDTGINFQNNYGPIKFWKNHLEIPNNQIDDDKNGVIDDIHGYDFVNEDGHPEDENGHGTHVTGLISSIDKKNDDLFGIAPNAEIIVTKVFDKKGLSNSIDLARAIIYLSKTGAQIVNCSWGGGSKSLGLADAFQILSEKGVFVISSAGNTGINTDKYPQVPIIYPGVTAIGASNKKGKTSNFSNFGGKSVKLLLPGEDILSTYGTSFKELSGTSMSAAIASGITTLLLGIYKNEFPDRGPVLKANTNKIKIIYDALCSSKMNKQKWASECGEVDLVVTMATLFSWSL